MRKIDISEYVKSGAGANGSSYDKIDDSSVMLKLYNTDYPTQTIFDEHEVAKKAFEIGVPSPEPSEIVTNGERIGIQFKRIVGKRSYSRAIADEPERVEEYSREFARYCKKIHQLQCPEGMFPSAKEQFLHMLEVSKTYTPEQKSIVKEFIESVPDCMTALHGDMHIGNVITTLPKGAPMSTPHDVYFIDLGYFSYGYPLFDLGMLYSICLTADEDFRQQEIHLTGEMTKIVWKYFIDEYFFQEDNLAEKYFGKDATLERINEILTKFSCIKLLLVEFNLGFLPENYLSVVKKTFNF